jgi:hypothetical protein
LATPQVCSGVVFVVFDRDGLNRIQDEHLSLLLEVKTGHMGAPVMQKIADFLSAKPGAPK